MSIPDGLQESLLTALSFAQSYSRVVVVPDTASFPPLNNHPLVYSASSHTNPSSSPSTSSAVRFVATASIFVHGIKVGNLCLFDSKPHETFTTEQQGLLIEFAETIADIWVDRKQLYHKLHRDGLHLQHTLFQVLRVPLCRIMKEADQVEQFLRLQQRLWQSHALNKLDKTLTCLQTDVYYFEYMVSLAVKVIAIAKLPDVHDENTPFTYDLFRETWRESIRDLIYQYGLLQLWVYNDDKVDFTNCKLLAHPCVIHFCIAALLGHIYCSNSQQSVHITSSVSSPLLSQSSQHHHLHHPQYPNHFPTRSTTSSFSSTTTHESSGSSCSVSDTSTVQISGPTRPTHNTNINTNINSNITIHPRRLCIQICSQGNIPPVPDTLRHALDKLTGQYLQGHCRQVTNHCLQILVPVQLEEDMCVPDKTRSNEVTACVTDQLQEEDKDDKDDDDTVVFFPTKTTSLTPVSSDSIAAVSQHKELQLAHEKHKLFPELFPAVRKVSPFPSQLAVSSREEATVSRVMDREDHVDFHPLIPSDHTTQTQQRSGHSHLSVPGSRATGSKSAVPPLFTTGVSPLLQLTSYQSVAHHIRDSCRALFSIYGASLANTSKITPCDTSSAVSTPLTKEIGLTRTNHIHTRKISPLYNSHQ